MTTPFLDLLKQINDGVIIYEPLRRSGRELAEFHDTVERLKEMERLGLIGHLLTQTRTAPHGDYIDFVMVRGGLTPEGKRLLEDSERQSDR